MSITVKMHKIAHSSVLPLFETELQSGPCHHRWFVQWLIDSNTYTYMYTYIHTSIQSYSVSLVFIQHPMSMDRNLHARRLIVRRLLARKEEAMPTDQKWNVLQFFATCVSGILSSFMLLANIQSFVKTRYWYGLRKEMQTSKKKRCLQTDIYASWGCI